MNYTSYGTNKINDSKVNDKYVPTRVWAAEHGYALDKLATDPDFNVRTAVANYYASLVQPLDEDDKKIVIALANDEDPIVRAASVKAAHNDKEILSMLENDENVSVRCKLAGIGYKLDKFYKDEAGAVRQVVAEQGYALDELVKTTDPLEYGVKDAVIDYYHANRLAFYGSNSMLDSLANSESAEVRAEVARVGYAPEILMYDNDWRVRKEVADLNGYGYYKLVNDPNEKVRETLAEQGRYEICDLLVNDNEASVRAAVAEIGFDDHLAKLLNDSEPEVRRAVAMNGFRPDILCRDDDPDVREAVATGVHSGYSRVIDELKDDPVWSVRAALANSGKALDYLKDDPIPAVRQAVVFACEQYADNSKEILKYLSKDKVESVAKPAQAELERISAAKEKDNISKDR